MPNGEYGKHLGYHDLEPLEERIADLELVVDMLAKRSDYWMSTHLPSPGISESPMRKDDIAQAAMRIQKRAEP